MAHSKQKSTLRSVAYYQDEKGRGKKKDLNAKRKGAKAKALQGAAPGQAQDSGCVPVPAAVVPAAGSADKEQPPGAQSVPDVEPQTSPCPPEVAQALPKAKDPVLIEYVRKVVGLIQKRFVSLEEIWRMLLRVLRQQGIGRRKKIDQVVEWLKKNPP